MSFVQRWKSTQIIQDLSACHAQVVSSYNDGFTAWACKQDLYRVKFELDQMLKDSPMFAGEQEWLEEQQRERDKRQTWRTLKQV